MKTPREAARHQARRRCVYAAKLLDVKQLRAGWSNVVKGRPVEKAWLYDVALFPNRLFPFSKLSKAFVTVWDLVEAKHYDVEQLCVFAKDVARNGSKEWAVARQNCTF